MADEQNIELASLTVDIVSAYVANNTVPTRDLAALIAGVHMALDSAGAPAKEEVPDHTVDKAAIRKSLADDYLTSFIDGRKYKSLKRHLSTRDTTPDEYRAKFGLPKDYPMVAPSYSAQRSQLARTLGLGRKAVSPKPTPAPVKGKAASKPKAVKAEDETFS